MSMTIKLLVNASLKQIHIFPILNLKQVTFCCICKIEELRFVLAA